MRHSSKGMPQGQCCNAHFILDYVSLVLTRVTNKTKNFTLCSNDVEESVELE